MGKGWADRIYNPRQPLEEPMSHPWSCLLQGQSAGVPLGYEAWVLCPVLGAQ